MSRTHALRGGSGKRAGIFVYSSRVTELYRKQEDALDYQCLRLKNMEQRHFRKKCPCCGCWNYPQLGLLKNACFGIAFIMYVISKRIETALPYHILIADLAKTFGKNFGLRTTAIIYWSGNLKIN